MRLQNNQGLPWTASTGLGWIVLVVALSSGTALLALSLYLALWIYTKGRSALPLFGFALMIPLGFLDLAFAHWAHHAAVLDILAIVETALWIGSTFMLRHAIIAHYRDSEGWKISIGPWFTLFFSSLYINYCLNPVTISDGKDTVTSLNLSSGSDSAKIAK